MPHADAGWGARALALSLMLALPAGAALADEPLVPKLPAECGAPCAAVKAMLTAEDADELGRLVPQVAHGLTIGERAMLPLDNDAEMVLRRSVLVATDGRFDKVKTGIRTCTVYWYGFLDHGSEKVGTHLCKVSRKGGVLGVEKTTGDGMLVSLYPYAAPVDAYVGRTFTSDQIERKYDKDHPANDENDNYGNKVGLALADKGRLYLVSINERGFSDPDLNFFEIIAIE
ncbi:MAG TPA: hypothetical protein VFB16_16410 [Bauldia sp.]|nr:hypothetical protein [Bauldia sp.]